MTATVRMKGLERAFGGRDDANGAGVEFHGVPQGAAKGLEHGLGLVVRVFTAQVVNVQRDKGVVHKALEKLKGQLRIKVADHAALEGHVHFQTGAAREVHHHAAESLVQRHKGMAVSAQSLFVAHSDGHGLAQRDADVFHGVVAVNVQVARGLDVQVNQAVTGDLVQHVVEEANAGGQLGLARAVQVDAHEDLGFFGVAADFSGAWCHGVGGG